MEKQALANSAQPYHLPTVRVKAASHPLLCWDVDLRDVCLWQLPVIMGKSPYAPYAVQLAIPIFQGSAGTTGPGSCSRISPVEHVRLCRR
jgi:hypothetical protein